MPADIATAQFNNVARYEALMADLRFIVPDELAVIDLMCFGPRRSSPPTGAGRSDSTRS